MDKYQQYLLLQHRYAKAINFIFTNCAPIGEKCKDNTYGSYDIETNSFTIKQDSDITKTKYELVISKRICPFIKSVQKKQNGEYTDISLSTGELGEQLVIPIDFDNRIDSLKLSFDKNIVDDLEINIIGSVTTNG